MSAMEFNKFVAAILVAGLVFMAINVGVDEAMHRTPSKSVAFPVPMDETVVVAAAVIEQAPVESLGALLAAADVASGKKLARKCSSCHSFDKGGKNKVGPNLWDIVGRDMAQVAGYNYSSALAGMGGVWDYAALDRFLTKPKEMVPGTKMSFAGVKKPAGRADLIAFLRGQSDNPPPLPAAE
jgi:cytochrome c